MEERFPKPCVGAIIEKKVDGETYILVQTRAKENGGATNGLLEIPAGKIREYENIFDALIREVMEETGLTITKIHGEKEAYFTTVGANTIMSFEPFCITQNLSGIYSIILNTFLCEATGELLEYTNETTDIHWMKTSDVKSLVEKEPGQIFLMHINALKKYLNR